MQVLDRECICPVQRGLGKANVSRATGAERIGLGRPSGVDIMDKDREGRSRCAGSIELSASAAAAVVPEQANTIIAGRANIEDASVLTQTDTAAAIELESWDFSSMAAAVSVWEKTLASSMLARPAIMVF